MDLRLEKAEKIMTFISDENYTPMRAKDIAFLMSVPGEDMALFQDILAMLEQEGRIIVTKKGKVIQPSLLKIFSGVFIGHARGFGFVVLDEGGNKDIFIPAPYVNGAMHMDKVLCRIIPIENKPHSHNAISGEKRMEGEIVRILEKGMDTLVGTFVKEKNNCLVVPDEAKIPRDIIIRKNDAMSAVSGHKVVVKLFKTPTGHHNPEGKVIEILGHKNDPGVDVLSIVKSYKLPTAFPDNALAEAEALPDYVSDHEMDGRRNLRGRQVITIDGEDTKDIDDAISLDLLPNGNFLLGVHIADVTHYVQENSALDREALKRGTSVYLADRVIPMLPHRLSNGICSLNAGETRLALSCDMEIDGYGRLVNHEIFPSVIQVDRRMTYTLVHHLLTEGFVPDSPGDSPYIPLLKSMEALSLLLRGRREKRGAIEFDLPEAKIIVNDIGMPIDIKIYERNTATGIIEEFMLVCNETIAEEYFYREMPFVYRSHEKPDAEKMQKLAEYIRHFGYYLKGNAAHPKELQGLLSKIEHTPENMIISRIILRSLKQARYTFTNEGHFGLAAKYYCHFTSPIRRYPDLQIHRIIKESIHSGESNGNMYFTGFTFEERVQHYDDILPMVCSRCSVTERVAEEAEREVENLKKVQFMKDKLGQSFDGIISSITSWGIYVALPNTVEGMVSLENMNDDYYIFYKDKLMLVGERTKKIYRPGEAVRITLVRADEETRRLDFIFAEDEAAQQ